MSYAVKEMFLTLQGEGAQTGRAAVFLRFAGCNLWTGREEDRRAAVCRFCDTDFVGTDGVNGGKFADAEALAARVSSLWLERRPPHPIPFPGGERGWGEGAPLVVCTGGEPLLQLDAPLIHALKARGFKIAIESNGTIAATPGLDWICISPKAGAPLVQTCGDELKLVFPQEDAEPERFAHLDFRHFFLQPMDGPAREENTQAVIRYCLAHPKWRLSLQTHKLIGIP